MIDTDSWRDLLDTLQKNRLRTALTIFGVFWGSFMLVAMLGFGGGLERGVARSMSGFANNAVFMWGRRTAKPFDGFQPGRTIRFRPDDVAAVKKSVDGLEYLCPRVQLGGHGARSLVTRGDKVGSFQVLGDVPEMIHVQPLDILEGRFLNPLDLAERRKVAVIGVGVFEKLFDAKESALGGRISVGGVLFEVVGKMKGRRGGDQGEEQAATILVPITTFQAAFKDANRVDWLTLTAQPDIGADVVEKRVKAVLQRRHHVHPQDPDGVGSFNLAAEYGKVQALFLGIRGLTWFVGLMTLIAGVVGISNIMLIVVRERTKEIGIRRAIGATPWTILGMILQEAVALTALAGYAGVVLAVAMLEVVARAVGDAPDTPFTAPGIDLGTALFAGALLAGTGVLAGLIPARAALRIRTVEALRAE